MADRWSNPSGSRFRIWPSSTDSYDHLELAANWDKLDALIGIPTGGGWPPTEGVGGGIWLEIQKAKEAAVPLGVAIPWFRANTEMEVPDGYVLADGSTLQADEHQIPNVSGPYTVPDLRNRFVIGANANTTTGTPGVDPTDSLINSASGAPGPGGSGGENVTKLTISQMAAHKHTGSLTGWSPILWTWYNNADGKQPATDNYEVIRSGAGCSTGVGDGGMQFGQHRHSITLPEVGNDIPHENRPLYVGLVWIVKVRNVL